MMPSSPHKQIPYKSILTWAFLRGKWQVIILLILGILLEAMGLISLVSLLHISDESKWRILLGLGVGLVIIGYFLLKRATPRATQKPPPSIKPNTHCQDSCSRSDRIGRKFSHIPNIPRKAFSTSNTPRIIQVIPITCLAILSFSHRYRYLSSLLILGLFLLGWNIAQFWIHSNYIFDAAVNIIIPCLALTLIILIRRKTHD
jgi:hypothetical protein